MNTEFGKLLKHYRRAMDMTQDELVQRMRGQLCPISNKGVISKWEHGSRPNSLETVGALQDILRVPDNLLLKEAGYYQPIIETELTEINSASKYTETDIPELSDNKGNLTSSISPDAITEALKSHFELLAGIAEAMVNTNDLNTVRPNNNKQPPYNKVEYWIGKNDNEEAITASEISDLLQANFDTMYDIEGQFSSDCFVSHFNSEKIGLKIPDDFIVKPFEIIHTLKVLSKRKTFKGICPICEGW